MVFDPFDRYDITPPDPIFFISSQAAADQRPEKVDLTIGIYKTAELKSMVFKSIREAEKKLLENETNKDYLSISGHQALIDGSIDLVFGKDHCERAICGIQALGGTGALCLGANLLAETLKMPVYVSKPTWVNHHNVFSSAGFMVKDYFYYDQKTQSLNIDAFFEALNRAEKGSVVVLHGCCHNPSGADPDLEQWKEISDLCKARQLIPFFDLAYQGFGQGLEQDVRAIRLFAKDGHSMLVAQSFSKNLGLYGERVGTLLVLTSEKSGVISHLKAIARASYSNPPRHGGLIAAHVLSDPHLRSIWEDELNYMRQRVNSTREHLADALAKSCPNHDFSYLKERNGMFCYLDLTKDHIESLKTEKAIYLTQSGRINVTGLNEQNVVYVADSIASVLE